jgi:aspartyl-tRNA(Asn)/glutamyl-tRNA(Gln) amidotransferase subunit C
MSISNEEMRHLAELSNLQMTDEELSSRKTDLENILGYIDQLNELNTDGIEPTYSVADLSTIWREDEITDYGVTGDDLLALRSDNKNHATKVPKVL